VFKAGTAGALIDSEVVGSESEGVVGVAGGTALREGVDNLIFFLLFLGSIKPRSAVRSDIELCNAA